MQILDCKCRAEREDFDHFGLKVVLHPPSNVRAFDPVFSFVHRNKILRFVPAPAPNRLATVPLTHSNSMLSLLVQI